MVKGGGDGAKENDFFTAFEHEYTVNQWNNTGSTDSASSKCSKKNFEGVNVAPGVDKVCFCDEDQLQMDAPTV